MTQRLTTARIRRDIQGRGENEIFTTRQMLVHGTRNAVDIALFKMVRDGTLRRLARGVFVKATCTIIFQLAEIALVKARAFGKRILCQDHRRSLSGLPIADELQPGTFVVDGPSSSFQYGAHRIYFKSAVGRKFSLGDTLAGCVSRLLWQKRNRSEALIASSCARLGGQSRLDIRGLLSLLPHWLHDQFVA